MPASLNLINCFQAVCLVAIGVKRVNVDDPSRVTVVNLTAVAQSTVNLHALSAPMALKKSDGNMRKAIEFPLNAVEGHSESVSMSIRHAVYNSSSPGFCGRGILGSFFLNIFY